MLSKTRDYRYPKDGEYQPVVLRRYGGDWQPLSQPTTDERLARSIADGERTCDDSILAAGVMSADLVVREMA